MTPRPIFASGVDIDAVHRRTNTDSAGRAYWVGKPGESLPHDRAVAEERLAGCDAGHQCTKGAATAIVPSGTVDPGCCEETARARGEAEPAFERCQTRAGKVWFTGPQHPRVAAPDDRPHGQAAGAAPAMVSSTEAPASASPPGCGRIASQDAHPADSRGGPEVNRA